jgi:hypothetical protein
MLQKGFHRILLLFLMYVVAAAHGQRQALSVIVGVTAASDGESLAGLTDCSDLLNAFCILAAEALKHLLDPDAAHGMGLRRWGALTGALRND